MGLFPNSQGPYSQSTPWLQLYSFSDLCWTWSPEDLSPLVSNTNKKTYRGPCTDKQWGCNADPKHQNGANKLNETLNQAQSTPNITKILPALKFEGQTQLKPPFAYIFYSLEELNLVYQHLWELCTPTHDPTCLFCLVLCSQGSPHALQQPLEQPSIVRASQVQNRWLMTAAITLLSLRFFLPEILLESIKSENLSQHQLFYGLSDRSWRSLLLEVVNPDGPAGKGHCCLWKWHMVLGLMFLIKLELRRWPWSNCAVQLLTASQPPLSSEVFQDAESKLFRLNLRHGWSLPGVVKMWSNVTAADRRTLSPNRTPLTWNKTGGQVSALFSLNLLLAASCRSAWQ